MAWMARLAAMAVSGGEGGGGGGGGGPTAPPSNVYRSTYSGSKIQINWTSEDVTATSRVYEGGVFKAELAAGIESWGSGKTSFGEASVSHKKNGIETSATSEEA